MRDWSTEEGDNPITKNLVDDPAKGGDVASQTLKATVDEVLHFFGIEVLREGRKAHQISEKGSDNASLFVTTGLGGAAVGTETPARWDI